MASELDLPQRVVVGANGAYWRDYGTYYSMCPVSDDNDLVEVVAVFVRSRLTGAEEWARGAAAEPDMTSEQDAPIEAVTARLHATTDASVWAEEFDRLYPDRRPDSGTMLGWFANAIEVGRMAGARQEPTDE